MHVHMQVWYNTFIHEPQFQLPSHYVINTLYTDRYFPDTTGCHLAINAGWAVHDVMQKRRDQGRWSGDMMVKQVTATDLNKSDLPSASSNVCSYRYSILGLYINGKLPTATLLLQGCLFRGPYYFSTRHLTYNEINLMTSVHISGNTQALDRNYAVFCDIKSANVPKRRWGSLQHSPIPPCWWAATSRSLHPHPPPLPPPLLQNPASAPGFVLQPLTVHAPSRTCEIIIRPCLYM